MADLNLSTGQLRGAGTDLRAVATEFENANANSRALGEALGHEGLASTVRGFAVSWDDRRASMIESIAALAEACSAIGDTFESLDSEFAAALKGE